jgi:hypothetical protein
MSDPIHDKRRQNSLGHGSNLWLGSDEEALEESTSIRADTAQGANSIRNFTRPQLFVAHAQTC